jgi:hypothetical protein
MTKQNWGLAAFHVHRTDGTVGRIIVSGRDRWALECLRMAGPKGCTPIDQPGPRWSAYVFNLKEMGVEIEKITEPHKGDFPGHHARYVLQSRVTRAEGVAL